MEAIPLSPEDEAILELEGPTIVGHTCKVVRLEPPGPTLAELRASIERRLAAAPELGVRLEQRDAGPVWVPDPGLSTSDHVVEAPSAGGEEELRARIAGLFADHLDRDRPLWRLDLVPVRDGAPALVWRIHHALADGTATMRLAGAVLWVEEGAGSASTPRRSTRAADAERRRGHLAGMLEREFGRGSHPPFDGAIGRRRSVGFAHVPLAPLHDAAKRLAGGTVNDAVLAAVAGGVRSWIDHHHGNLDSLRLRVPVSLHQEGDSASNRDSFFTVPAPLAEPDPVQRLIAIHEAAAERKAAGDAERIDSLLETLGGVSGGARRLAQRLEEGSRSFALCVSNVPGPRGHLAVCGSPVRSVHSLAEVGRHHGLRVAVVSACGDLGFGFCADPAIVDDVERLAAAVEEEAAALIAAA